MFSHFPSNTHDSLNTFPGRNGLRTRTSIFTIVAAACLLPSVSIAQDARSGVGIAGLKPRQYAAANDLSDAFHQVAESMRSSVVAISTKQIQRIPPSIEDFFGRRVPRMRERESSGMGSGVIVRSNGYVLTNNHVIEDVDEVGVELFDGRVLPAEIVGTDPQTDLAVLKIDATGLRPAPFGNSDDIRVGDWVLAIGSPFGLDQTVTAGIISGKNRVQRIIADGEGFEDFLQTDAAINPGNSGGPLVNLRGECVGINTAILSRSGSSAGIGFAIPVALAQPVLNSIIETGEVRRGFLGASVVDVNPKNVGQFDLKVNRGGLIAAILDDQPAAEAGLKPGDVVVKMDGKQVIGGTQLRNYIASRLPGSVVNMLVNRNGRLMQMAVKLKERTEQAMAMFDPDEAVPFGAKLTPVTPRTAAALGFRNLRQGLIVSDIQEGTIASDMGLREGDVITSVQNYPIRTVEQFVELVSDLTRMGRGAILTIRRGNSELTIRPSE